MSVQNHHAFRIRPRMRRGLYTEVPLPTRLVSNEEFPPQPQTAAQKEVGRGIARVGLERQLHLPGGRLQLSDGEGLQSGPIVDSSRLRP